MASEQAANNVGTSQTAQNVPITAQVSEVIDLDSSQQLHTSTSKTISTDAATEDQNQSNVPIIENTISSLDQFKCKRPTSAYVSPRKEHYSSKASSIPKDGQNMTSMAAKKEPTESLNRFPRQSPMKLQLSTTEIHAAQNRRREILKRIDTALAAWRPTMPSPYSSICSKRPRSQIIQEFTQSQKQQKTKSLSAVPDVHKPFDSDSDDSSQQLDFSPIIKKKPQETKGNVVDVRELSEDDGKWDQSVFKSQEVQQNLDPYQEAALKAAIDGESFFLTGSAGTGKSFVLRLVIDELRQVGKRVAVTASTGCAAVALQGNTIHSVSGVGLGKDSLGFLRRKVEKGIELRNRLRGIDVLIIDEISMIDSFLLDKIEFMFRYARDKKFGNFKYKAWRRGYNSQFNGHSDTENTEPFGGVQVVLCGDFFQLPPVKPSEHRYAFSEDKYFAFESETWKRVISKTFVLRVVHRQDDDHFVGLLDEMRRGFVSEYTINLLRACYVPVGDALEVNEQGEKVEFTKLFAFRNQVDYENKMQLRQIKQPGIRYYANTSYDRRKFGNLPEKAVQSLVENLNALVELDLKVGARVLCIKNIRPAFGIVNGAGGQVIGFRPAVKHLRKLSKEKKNQENIESNMADGCFALDGTLSSQILGLEDELIEESVTDMNAIKLPNQITAVNVDEEGVLPVVRFDNGVIMAMLPETWEVYGLLGQVIATRIQIPLMLGWALSTHKSQGMTIGNVEADVGKAFDCGQVYVALSRATSIRELRLRSFSRSRVMSHKKVAQFYRMLNA